MGFNDEYQKLRKKRLEEEQEKKPGGGMLYRNKTATAEDIAPVVTSKKTATTEKEEDNDRTWFNKGAFDDGYQFGDVIKTIVGTTKDLNENLSAGIYGMGEKVVDAGAYLVGGAAGLFGADEFKDKTGEFIAKDLYDEEALAKKISLADISSLGTTKIASKILGIDGETDSVLGEKTDSLAQSGGQLLATMGLQAVGVPWWVTSGVTSFGGAAEGALNEGATYGEAGVSAAISAGAEILTEKMFGGSGLGEKGLINLEPLTKGISSKVVKSLADLGVDMAAEGAEEVVSSVAGRLGSALYKEESLGEILASEEAFDEYLESFIGGAALGGVMNTGKAAGSIKTGTDYRTGLNKDESRVIDTIVDERIAEQEKDGKKLKGKEKENIREQVMRDFERGYIAVDDIERILGGESYNTYKNMADTESAKQAEVQKQIEELENLPNEKITVKQAEQLKGLRQDLQNLKDSAAAPAWKDRVSESVYWQAKGSRLEESYNERARRGQAFQADLTQYDTKQAEIVKKAAESGILNNTNRTHEFVDMVAKISADKGVLFDFTNNSKLKESGFAVDGATVNGYFDKKSNTVGVNIDSAKAFDTVVGHEITHVLEGTELYSELQKAVFDYARTKGEYDGRRESLAKLYAEEDIDSEMTADLVGEYLFTDADFVSNLSVTNRNVFQKIYDEIKYLYKVVTAGSKEARELEKVKRAFDKAYRESGKASGDPDIRFSLSESVEETNDLMAIHNLTAEKLLKSIKLGGLPMPSVAIARAQDGHNEFGDISLILQKDAIDPATSRYNKVYSGDAWTPTYPRVEYKVNSKVSKQIGDKIHSLVPSDVINDLGNVHFDTDNMTDTLNRFGGNVADAFGSNYALKYAYLQDSGVDIALPMKEKNISYYGTRENGAIIKVAEALTQEELITALNGGHEVADQYEPIIRKAVAEYTQEKYGDVPELLDIMMPREQLTYNELDGYISEALSYHRKGVERTVDTNAARELINEQVNQSEYETWLNDLFSGIVEKEGIRNNADYFTPSGNRRSFEALHYEHNLENVIKAMREKGAKGVGAFGSGNILGASTTEFGSIKELKQSTDRLRMMSQDEFDKIRKQYTDRFFDLASSLPKDKNSFIATDDAANMLVEAVTKYKTRSGIANYLRRESQGWANYSEYVVDDLIELVEDIRKMPTGYFEAKPQRAVGFDEVGVFVIPNNADAKLKQELLNRGYSIAEYDPDVEGDRQKVVNSFEQYKFSLSAKGEAPTKGRFYGKDIRLEVAPVAETKTETAPEAVAPVETDAYPMPDIAPEETYAPTLYDLYDERDALREQMLAVKDDLEAVAPLAERYGEVMQQIQQLEAEESERLASLDDADIPPEVEAPYYESDNVELDDPFEKRDIKDVGNKNVKAYMYENPEVKPFFQQEANVLLGELSRTTKGERFYTETPDGQPGVYGAESYGVWTGTSRDTSPDIAYLLDTLGYSYAEIEKGLKAIIEDNGAENNACSKRIEFILHDRLVDGYSVWDVFGGDVPPNQEYINLLKEKQIMEYTEQARKQFFEVADRYAPMGNNEIVVEPIEDIARVKHEAIRPKQTREPSMKRVDTKAEKPEGKIAKVLTEEPQTAKKGANAWAMFKNNVLDKGMVFEDLSLKTGNRELQARWNTIRYAEGKAQKLIGEGNESVSSLQSIRQTVENSGKTEAFYNYLYHKHNVDRMSLEAKAAPTIGALRSKFGHLQKKQIQAIAAKEITDKTTERTAQTIREAKEYLNAIETKNKPVFGDDVTADVSKERVAEYEKANPEFKAWAQDVYGYMNYLREMLVNDGVISRDTARLWAEMYPNYVPIRRDGKDGMSINVPLDTGRTGINAPIKRAEGGNSDILPLFDTMAMRTQQTYRAIARNRFGVELKNTLGTTIDNTAQGVDDTIESIDNHDELLKEGKNGERPTFTVFENGEKVTFEISEEMYDAMKPTSKELAYTNKVANTVGNVFRGLLTEYNPVFMTTNAAKDVQDILINSQHPARTYAAIPKAISQMAKGGHWYNEYLANGGEQNTYFEGESKTFKAEDEGWKKVVGMPLKTISYLNNTIERVPRLAEYIASREAGQSVDVAMLDAARVTTNFAAGGDLTKALNRNGFTFLNASMQGAVQQVRNVREAKANGLKGWVQLAAKVAAAGLPAMLLNALLWDDDEDYEELSDYVKQNYYVVAKFGDGKFVRIPKGRTVAVIQNAFEQVGNALTGDDEVDLQSFLELAISNLAPNNPLENNILAPIMQVANNETWYGEDLVPTRLQDLPDAEQYDESTDAISRWLGEKLNYSPYKINYLLNQYSGGLGDVLLPMLTPEAESGDNSLVGNMIAPFKDKFTTDSTMKNQNVSDFYDTVDELTKNAKSSNATDEDVLKYKYMNSVNAELSELYKQKREIQNSDLSDAEKYDAVRKIQRQIDDLAAESLETYGDVYINDGYATVGDRHYRLKDGEWQKISDDQLDKQNEVVDGLGIDPSEYWANKSEYDFAYEYPEKYAVAKSVGGYEKYKTYSSELYDIKADKDENGKSITGSRKEKVVEYINNLDADYGERLILFKSEYNADDTYNEEIIDYLNNREDISYDEMVAILTELGFTVKNGHVYWD